MKREGKLKGVNFLFCKTSVFFQFSFSFCRGERRKRGAGPWENICGASSPHLVT